MIEDLPVMGYAMATDDDGSTYRYTEVCTHDRLGLPHPSTTTAFWEFSFWKASKRLLC